MLLVFFWGVTDAPRSEEPETILQPRKDHVCDSIEPFQGYANVAFAGRTLPSVETCLDLRLPDESDYTQSSSEGESGSDGESDTEAESETKEESETEVEPSCEDFGTSISCEESSDF